MQEPFVMCLDDDTEILDTMGMLLEDQQYPTHMTADPQEALAFLEKNTVSVLITDFEMPSTNGLEVLEKAREISPSTIRIMATGHTETDVVLPAINSGNVYKYFTKPLEPEALLQGIGEAVSYYKELEEARSWIVKQKHYKDSSGGMEILQTQLDEREAELQMILAENQEMVEKQKKDFSAIFSTLALIIQLRNKDLHNAGQWISKLAVRLGQQMDLSPKRLSQIQIAANLKYLGIVMLPDRLTEKKRGMLTAAELQTYYRYPLIGQKILERFRGFQAIGAIVGQTLERADGGGILGLTEEDIRPEAQVITLADDAYQIMHSKGAHLGREIQYGKTYMINHLRKNMGKLYSSKLSKLAISLFSTAGSTV